MKLPDCHDQVATNYFLIVNVAELRLGRKINAEHIQECKSDIRTLQKDYKNMSTLQNKNNNGGKVYQNSNYSHTNTNTSILKDVWNITPKYFKIVFGLGMFAISALLTLVSILN